MYGDAYANQKTTVMFGSKSATNTLTPVALTASFGGATTTKEVETAGKTMVAMSFSYTMGAAETANSLDIRVRASSDKTNWYTIVNDNTTGAVSTLTQRTFTIVGADAANIKFSLPLEVMYDYIEVSVKESGVATTAGTIFAEITTSGN